jgi:hypothetical protein
VVVAYRTRQADHQGKVLARQGSPLADQSDSGMGHQAPQARQREDSHQVGTAHVEESLVAVAAADAAGPVGHRLDETVTAVSVIHNHVSSCS